jgi:hypothetical protein
VRVFEFSRQLRVVRAIVYYVLSISQIHQLCSLNRERCPPNFVRHPRCPRNPWLCPLNLPNLSTMSAQSRKMFSQYHPAAMMSAQFLIMSSQSPESIIYVHSNAKNVRPIPPPRKISPTQPSKIQSSHHILSFHPIPAILNSTIQKEVDTYQNNA